MSSAFLPVAFSHLAIMTSQYLGSSSIMRQRLCVCSHAISVVPDPPNRSRTVSPSPDEFSMARATRATGFIMGCSSDAFGLSNSHTSSWVRSVSGFLLGSPALHP